MRRSVGSVSKPRRRDGAAFALNRRLIAAAVGSAFAASAFANPTGGSVAAGNATFVVNGKTLTVTNSPGAIINWQQFSIAQDEITRFIQQNAASAVLNRVVGQDPTQILGQLLSNGRVFLINPNGIVFGKGSVIDVAGFAASTLRLSDADFLSGRQRFEGTGAEGKLTNLGTIKTVEGGHVYLVAPNVENSAGAVITSPKGEVVIAAGKTVELVNARTPDIRVEFTAPQGEAVNAGQIVASSGHVGIYGALVKNSGLVSASRAVVGDGGKIVLKAVKDVTLDASSKIEANGAKGGSISVQAETGTLLAQGTIEAKGEEAKGGDIRLLGNRVAVNNALVDASGKTGGGSVLIGGDYQGANPAVQNAQRTVVTPGAVIKADATGKGDGGKVIVWADGDTRFYGSITARGGLEGGDGGFVEVSGKQTLTFSGTVDTRAPLGVTGTLLLDPGNITIAAGTVNTPAFEANASDGLWAFSEDTGTQTIGASNVAAILNNTNLNLQASGNITIQDNANITYSNTPTRDFTLTANESVMVGGGVNISSSGNGALNIRFIADNNGDQVGGILVGNGSVTTTLATNGGSITLGGAGATSSYGTGATFNTGVHLNSALLSSAGGNIVIRGAGRPLGTFAHGVVLDGNSVVQVNGGSVQIEGAGANGRGVLIGFDVTRPNNSIQTLGVGNISIVGTAATGTSAYGVHLVYGNVISSDSGSISIQGNALSGAASGVGVFIQDPVRSTSTAANAGSITIIGGSANVTGTYGSGFEINGGYVESTVGDISVTGSAGRSDGVRLTGAVSGVWTKGSANISVFGATSNGSSRGITVTSSGQVNGESGSTGNILLVADTMSIGGSGSFVGADGGTLTLRPATNARSIQIGVGANHTVALALIDLNSITGNHAIIGGGSQSGNVVVVGASVFGMGSGGTLTLQTSGSANVASTLSTAGNISLIAGNGIAFTQASGTALTAGGTKTVTLTAANGAITSSTANTDVSAQVLSASGNGGIMIDASVSNATLNNSVSGNATIINSGALNLGASQSAGGDIRYGEHRRPRDHRQPHRGRYRRLESCRKHYQRVRQHHCAGRYG